MPQNHVLKPDVLFGHYGTRIKVLEVHLNKVLVPAHINAEGGDDGVKVISHWGLGCRDVEGMSSFSLNRPIIRIIWPLNCLGYWANYSLNDDLVKWLRLLINFVVRLRYIFEVSNDLHFEGPRMPLARRVCIWGSEIVASIKTLAAGVMLLCELVYLILHV